MSQRYEIRTTDGFYSCTDDYRAARNTAKRIGEKLRPIVVDTTKEDDDGGELVVWPTDYYGAH